ncbi:cyclohexanecarboxylate-CoA ligase [Mycolicibacterium sp. BK556]|uniref:AMP-binding protein n=1 Tax=unclassified Mycolicibacterium TaxID=2636767 RepID=UPI00104E77DD|nr:MULTISPECIES: AMP-binding protein [unclassified Mycolicibacterium]MBB3607071.1 cyclohexanecarboxylate-CoA ligase [Mycolicibacterium sp. BK556]MBB3636819.1 cyclohexanecarboxylate-CoA ligase [Mycolicibacterium sp. BK607]
MTVVHRRLSDDLDGQYTPIDDATASQWRAAGWWENRSLRSFLRQAAATTPERLALVGRRTDGRRVTRTYREFDDNANHAANVLSSLGVSAGDAVVLMLPNWVEYAELIFAINELGAIYAGIPVAYGPRQAAAILERSKAKVLVIPRRWRSNENLELSRTLRAQIPTLEHVLVIDDDEDGLREGESLWRNHINVPRRVFSEPVPSRICYLGFTSGTTGPPKGAMHSHETLLYSARQLAEHIGPGTFGEPMVHLVASPVGHHTGYVWGVLFTVLMAGTAVHVDRWEPNWGVEVIRDEGVTTFFGAPAFLQDMLRTDLAGDPDCPLRCLVIAGAPIPRGLPGQARRALGAYIAPAWGMTECSIITSCTPAEPDEVLNTDGSVFAGSAIRIIDDSGRDVPAGVVGELVMRGPASLLGYYDRADATNDTYLPGLWVRTGDRASVDERGWLSLRGRSKDIIIRGGENIPVTDVESLIFDHPDVLNAAVVGVPDERLGERVCAVVVTTAGGPIMTLPVLTDYLLSQGLSKHYLPERVITVDELPMTPSGKIQKFKIREMFN